MQSVSVSEKQKNVRREREPKRESKMCIQHTAGVYIGMREHVHLMLISIVYVSVFKSVRLLFKHGAINFCNKKSIKSFIPVMAERQRPILFLFIDENSISPKTQPGIVKSLLIYFNFWNFQIFSHAFLKVLHSS